MEKDMKELIRDCKDIKSKVKARNFTFTSFNNEIEPQVEWGAFKYMAYEKEICPDTGREHWQGFFTMETSYTLGAMVQKINIKNIKTKSRFWHIERMYGSLDKNKQYCSKDKNFTEFGEKPKQGKRNDLVKLKDDIFEGKTDCDKIVYEEPMLYHQYGRTLEKIEIVAYRKKKREHRTEGLWYYGKTGSGKSYRAAQESKNIGTFIWTADKGWWDGYKPLEHKIVIIDDFRGNMPYADLLRLIDETNAMVPLRNKGQIPFLAKKVIITSSLTPEECYNNLSKNDKIDQLLRRLKIYRFQASRTENGVKFTKTHMKRKINDYINIREGDIITEEDGESESETENDGEKIREHTSCSDGLF